MKYVTLNNGIQMPMVGYGVFEIPAEQTAGCVFDALETGYRLIDTAQAYYNEKEVGDGIQRAIQVETHLFWQQYDLHEWMVKYNIQHEAWGPLAQHRLKEILESPIVKQIADTHGKTSAQVALRQHIQRGIVVIPKSVHKERMKQNLDIFDFELTTDEMEQLKALDENKSMWAEYDDPMIVQYAMMDE